MLRIFSGDEEGGLFVEGNEKKSQFHNARNLTRHAVLLKTIQKANQLNINSSTLVHLNNKTIKKISSEFNSIDDFSNCHGTFQFL